MKRSVRLLSLLAAILLLLAACSTAEETGEAAPEGGGEDVITEPALDEPTEPAADADTDADADADAENPTIAEIAATNPSFGTLIQALEAAGLTDALDEAGPLTVFAPNDEAFAQLDQGDLTALLADPSQLQDILQFHVVEGDFPSSELTDGQTLTTLAGSELTVSVDGSTVMVDGAEVVQPDIQAANGTIHVIDSVLQP